MVVLISYYNFLSVFMVQMQKYAEIEEYAI